MFACVFWALFFRLPTTTSSSPLSLALTLVSGAIFSEHSKLHIDGGVAFTSNSANGEGIVNTGWLLLGTYVRMYMNHVLLTATANMEEMRRSAESSVY